MGEPKTDCFAYKRDRCWALKEMVCRNGKSCSFYKTHGQLAKETAEHRAPLAGIPALHIPKNKTGR